MKLFAEKLSKRFGSQWIIKDFTYEFLPGIKYAVEGSNGSGKSTLLHLCCSYMEPSKGSCQFVDSAQKQIKLEYSYKYFTFSAPYLQMVPHFTIEEQLRFNGRLKDRSQRRSVDQLLDLIDLSEHKSKRMSSLSSGMRQRVRLITALSADVPFVFLDEPTTNLDKEGKDWYQQILEQEGKEKTLIIASNEREDLRQCTETINVMNYKD